MRHLGDHAQDLGRGLVFDGMIDLAQTQGLDGRFLLLRPVDRASDLRNFYLKDLLFFGNTIFQPGIFQSLVKYIEANEIKPMLAASYPLEELHAAQKAFIEKKHTGNIVVTME